MQNLRIHIVPIGLDPRERITEPLLRYKADRAYLVSYLKDSPTAIQNLDSAKKILEKGLPSCELKQVLIDIWDLFSCLKQYREIFKTEAGNHIYVNTSTGSKIACIAGMLACMMWDGHPYYARLDYSMGEPVKIESRKVIDVDDLPEYRLLKPDEQSLRVLSIVQKAGGTLTKKDLIKQLQSDEFRLIPHYGDNQPSAPHSRLRVILEPLQTNWDFVRVKSRGSRSEVTLTEQGKKALRIFGES